jgi:hypothetical protein
VSEGWGATVNCIALNRDLLLALAAVAIQAVK